MIREFFYSFPCFISVLILFHYYYYDYHWWLHILQVVFFFVSHHDFFCKHHFWFGSKKKYSIFFSNDDIFHHLDINFLYCTICISIHTHTHRFNIYYNKEWCFVSLMYFYHSSISFPMSKLPWSFEYLSCRFIQARWRW